MKILICIIVYANVHMHVVYVCVCVYTILQMEVMGYYGLNALLPALHEFWG